MPGYVDGFVLPIPKKNVPAYRKLASACGKIWREHGALGFRECVADDLEAPCGVPFPRTVGLKQGETVLFSWISFKSRAHRDRVNAKVMKDPRMERMMAGKKLPFDIERMRYGGFKVLVEA